MAASMLLIISLALASGPILGRASNKFLGPLHPSSVNKSAFQADIMDAMGSMLGCGGQAAPEKLQTIRNTLKPMWSTLPKSAGRIDRRSLRYLIHRYFMQVSSLMIRGFEPTRPVNDSFWGVADILSQRVPAYVESVLESRHAKEHGFGLDDTVNMVVMLEELIFDSEGTLLDKVYADQRKATQQSLSQDDLKQVLEAYMVEWMVDAEPEDVEMLLANRTMLAEVVPHFDGLVDFAAGRMKGLQFAHSQNVPKGRARDTWENRYSFQDAHQIVGGITTSFQSYWQSECDNMKSALVSMDEHNTGRVPLSKFYNTAINTDWRFGESEVYLRELGVLDESSSWLGSQVIIPNYIQATSNCIVSTAHYLVCCQNECESLLGEIEVAVAAPTASPSDILKIVSNMTGQTTIDDDDEASPRLAPEGMLAMQLQQVAQTNGGMVPLHGRLFAQWLHFVFPRECPFPHKMGAVSAVTPSQYGDDFIANNEDMRKHASNASAMLIKVDKEDTQWMSQWNPEEEFSVDYSSELSIPWRQRLFFGVGGLLLLVGGAVGGVIHWGGKQTPRQSSIEGGVQWI